MYMPSNSEKLHNRQICAARCGDRILVWRSGEGAVLIPRRDLICILYSIWGGKRASFSNRINRLQLLIKFIIILGGLYNVLDCAEEEVRNFGSLVEIFFVFCRIFGVSIRLIIRQVYF